MKNISFRFKRLQHRCAALVAGLLVLALAGLQPTLAQQATPVVDLTLGTSTQGRPITGIRVGAGPRKIVLVGATHGYPERNTFALVAQLADHFRAQPESVPADISLYIIPLLNPDGLELLTRFNANGVDLNRNMDTSADSCTDNDWKQRVSGAYGIESDTGGPYSESEVESRLIRDFLLDADAVVLFHSNAGVVFPACEHQPSIALARVFADGAGYGFIPRWDRYPISGGMHDWAGGLGIAAITPELVTGDLPEFEQNLAGVMAVLNSANEILPSVEARTEVGVEIQPIIWRAWRAWGGSALFGQPISPAAQTGEGWTQLFERGQLEYKPDERDTTNSVQSALLGRELFGNATNTPEMPQEGARFFPETQLNVRAPFADYWQINGGLPIFGLPLSAEQQTTDEGGTPVVRQVFERAVLQRPINATGPLDVSLVPLGRIKWAQNDVQSPETSIHVR